MRKVLLFASAFVIALTAFASASARQPALAVQRARIYIRTENYPRPPYSGATYYIYERDGRVICTKLEVCNKYDDCSVDYKKGSFKDEIDIETGDPYGKTGPVLIPVNKLRKHACLVKFKLV